MVSSAGAGSFRLWPSRSTIVPGRPSAVFTPASAASTAAGVVASTPSRPSTPITDSGATSVSRRWKFSYRVATPYAAANASSLASMLPLR